MVVETLSGNNTVMELGNGNCIIIGSDCVLNKTKVIFRGNNNILKMEGRVHVANSVIEFNGDESVAVLSSNCHEYYLNLSLNNNTVFHMGVNNYINGILSVILSEQKHVFFCNDSAISFGVWMRTADPHLVYSVESKERLNPSRSIFVGDHVWIGQGALVLKGSKIGSGSIIGAGSVVPGKRIPSNTIWVGNPARQVKDGVFWSGQCVHRWTDDETQKYQNMQCKR